MKINGMDLIWYNTKNLLEKILKEINILEEKYINKIQKIKKL